MASSNINYSNFKQKKMNKLQNLILSGATLSLSGLIMITAESIGVGTAKILIPILFITSGVFAILFANANLQSPITPKYHLFQGAILILFGLILALGATSLGDFLNYATYFILFIGLFDIILGFVLVNSDYNWTWGKLLFKTAGGFFGSIGGVAILVTSITDQYSGLLITGIITILMGIGTIVFASKIKTVST